MPIMRDLPIVHSHPETTTFLSLSEELLMKSRIVMASVAALAMLVATLYAADKLDGIKCPVSGKAVKEDKTVDYKGGKVYFCCENCPKAFEKDTAKFAVKANQQLAATGQYVQKACPLSGQKLNPEKTVKVGDVTVTFCCEKCQGKVSSAKGDEQAELVFADKAFDKAFEKKKS
jgi:YHS domain-containing protein